jgi:glutamate/aspartate transport system permease protein
LTMFFIQTTEETSRPYEMFIAVSGLYIVSAFAINRIMSFIEKRVRIPGFVVSTSGGGH